MLRWMHPIPGLYLALSVTLAAAPEPPAPRPPVPRVVQHVPPEMAEAILGREVAGADGKDVGRLIDVLVDGDGVPQAAVIDFGGFLGVGNRRIAVRWDTLHFAPSDPQRPITIDMTPDEIKAAPAFSNANKPAPVVTSEPAPQPAPGASGAAAPAEGSKPDGGGKSETGGEDTAASKPGSAQAPSEQPADPANAGSSPAPAAGSSGQDSAPPAAPPAAR